MQEFLLKEKASLLDAIISDILLHNWHKLYNLSTHIIVIEEITVIIIFLVSYGYVSLTQTYLKHTRGVVEI